MIEVAKPLGNGSGRRGFRDDLDRGAFVAHSLRADGFDASEDGTGRGTPLVTSFASKDHGADAMGDLSPTLRACVMPAIAFHARPDPDSGPVTHPVDTDGHSLAVALRGRDGGGTAELSDVPSALRASQGDGDKAHVLTEMSVRRLTPRECERLQGFPDDFTKIPWRGKPADQCPDGPRYKALGNSMAVNVMSWIGQRLMMAHDA